MIATKDENTELKPFKHDNMTSNSELFSAGKSSISLMNSNNYPKLVNKLENKKAILNLDNEGHGTHWVGIKPKNKNILRYYDSFGVPPPFHIKNKIITFNPYVHQKENELNCGKRAFNFVK